ncbi:MAG TPA: DUF420 domain-containing protein [Flavobacteriales bacterium]|nr:DUF420 domain-containing protein [Flavobacteriales bacterium]
MEIKGSIFLPVITIVSILIPILVACLMLLPGQEVFGDLSVLPLFHAILNGLTAIFLIMGFFLIIKKRISLHKACMVSALCLSSIFLISYVIYHYNTGHTVYGGKGWIRTVYFVILISHILLATSIVPLALITVFRGFANQIPQHRKIARWTLPIWLYVAITGVVVYLMMRPYYGG